MTLQLPATFKPTHQTSGLPGFPAIDCFAPGGTKVRAPAGGVVVKLSGHPPTATAHPGGPYGWSMYLRSSKGVYYLTHFGTRAALVTLGALVTPEQYIGTVAHYSEATHGVTPSHIHMGFHAGAWTP